MAALKSRWSEQSWAAHCQRVAQHKAKPTKERKPIESLWALGIAHGRELLEESPGEVHDVLDFAEDMVETEFSFRDGQDGAKLLAIHERRKQYYEGLLFALKHGRIKASFFAKGAPVLKELMSA